MMKHGAADKSQTVNSLQASPRPACRCLRRFYASCSCYRKTRLMLNGELDCAGKTARASRTREIL